MKCIIAGSRTVTADKFYKAIAKSKLAADTSTITEVVSGRANGVDAFGELWAYMMGIPVVPFEPDWDNLDAPGALVRVRKGDGKKYNARAGFDRNELMAQYADALILIWDGKSKGSADMLQLARKYSLIIENIQV